MESNTGSGGMGGGSGSTSPAGGSASTSAPTSSGATSAASAASPAGASGPTTGDSQVRASDLKAGDPIPGGRSALQDAYAAGRPYGIAADENADGSTKNAGAGTLPGTSTSATPVGTAGTRAR